MLKERLKDYEHDKDRLLYLKKEKFNKWKVLAAVAKLRKERLVTLHVHHDEAVPPGMLKNYLELYNEDDMYQISEEMLESKNRLYMEKSRECMGMHNQIDALHLRFSNLVQKNSTVESENQELKQNLSETSQQLE